MASLCGLPPFLEGKVEDKIYKRGIVLNIK